MDLRSRNGQALIYCYGVILLKKLIVVYVVAIALVFTLPALIAQIDKKIQQPASQNDLPKEIQVYFKDEGVVKAVAFEDYIKGVLPAEMPAVFHIEALKAQAVAARTYALNKYQKFTQDTGLIPEEHHGAIVCTDSKHCAAYYTKEQLLQIHGQEWMDDSYKKLCSAVDDTKNQIMVWEDQPILAVFHSSSSDGKTENSKDVWGGDIPYLVSVDSPEEKRDGSVSTLKFTDQEFRQKVADNIEGAVLSDDKNAWFKNVQKTEGGSVDTIEIGGVPVKGTKVREIFGLKSACFTVETMNDEIIFTVEGFGHGVGMSQYGANSMAQKGMGYQEILENYYKGAKLKK